MSPATLPAQPTAPGAPPSSLSLNALLEDALALVRAHPFVLLAPLVVMALLTAGGDGQSTQDRFAADQIAENPFVWIPFFAFLGLAALVLMVLLFLAYTWAWLATSRAALTLANGAPAPTLGQSLRETRPLLWRGAGTFLLYLGAVVLGFIALVVPGFIVLTALFPLGAVVAAEGLAGSGAMRRTWDLTRGHRWTLFGAIFIGGIASALAGVALGWLPVIGNALAGAAAGAVQGYLAVFAVLYYVRVRTSGQPTVPAATPTA